MIKKNVNILFPKFPKFSWCKFCCIFNFLVHLHYTDVNGFEIKWIVFELELYIENQ